MESARRARDADRGIELAAQLGGRVLVLDVDDGDGIATAAATVADLDVLVNNAGVSLNTGAAVTDIDVEVFRRTYETNVFGVVAVTNAFVPALRRSAHRRIVNISSGTGSLTWSTGSNPQFDYQTAGTGSGAAYRLKRPRSTRSPSSTPSTSRRRHKSQRALARTACHQPQSPCCNRRWRPGRAAAAAVRLALLPDDGPTGQLFSDDGKGAPW